MKESIDLKTLCPELKINYISPGWLSRHSGEGDCVAKARFFVFPPFSKGGRGDFDSPILYNLYGIPHDPPLQKAEVVPGPIRFARVFLNCDTVSKAR